MMRTALVQRYPYDSNMNGDFAYIEALREYLGSTGHQVITFTTNTALGRTSPLFTSGMSQSSVRHVRHAVNMFGLTISLDIRLWLKAVFKVIGRDVSKMTRDTERERAREGSWLTAQIKSHKIDNVILIYDGTWLAQSMVRSGLSLIAVPVFLHYSTSSLFSGTTEAGNVALLEAEIEPLKNLPFVGFHSNDDIATARQHGVKNPAKVGIGVQVERSEDRTRRPVANTILFVAALAEQNIDAVHWLLDSIMPLVRSKVSDAHLRIVGSIGRCLADRQPDASVTVVGFVDDLAQEYNATAVAVAPLRYGSKGLKVKVAEALAYACPLVATSICIDSSDHIWANDAMLLADTDEDFAAAIVSILASVSDQERLSQAAATVYDEHICYAAAYRELDIALNLQS